MHAKMLSFDEDGLDETAPYGPQHSTPVKSKYENSNSSLSSNPKCKLTVTQGKPLDRKEFRNSFTSPNNPNDCSMCKNADSSSKRQSAHMAQHFIPEDDVDISQIPPSEYCHAQHKSLSTNQCDPCYCPGQNSNATSSKNRKHALSDSLNHGEPTEGNIKCHLCAKTTTKDGTQSQPQYTPQHQCQCRPPSSSCHQSRTSSPTRRSYLCYPQHCLCHRTSDASLSALTSDCCSPKQNKSSACSIHSFARNSVRSGSGCRSPLCHHESSGQKFRSHSLPRTGCSGINLCNHSTEVDRSTLSIADITKTSAIFLDKDIMNKQREEIQLLMEELSARDQELNDMVTSHQKQVRIWEADRDRLNSLQARLTKYEEELSTKEQQLKATLEEMEHVQEQKEVDLTELSKTQADMVKLAERISENSRYIHEIEIQNKSLSAAVKELMAEKKHLEKREHELMQQLDSKNADLADQQAAMKRLTEKVKRLENQVEVIEEKCRTKVQENEAWRAKFFMEKDEAEKLAADCDSKDLTMAKMTQQLEESLQQAVALQKALFTSCEREKCKEEVLHSLRKQHKRTMQELSNIRELYDLQNQDLTTNHLSVKDRAGVHGKARVSSVTDKNDLTNKTSTMKEEPVACRKKRETLENKECIKSASNELSDSRTDAQFDGDEMLNTCHSHLTNVLVSPKSELQECNPNQKPVLLSKSGNHAPSQSHREIPNSEIATNTAPHSRTREKPHKFAELRLDPNVADPAQPCSEPPSQPHPSCFQAGSHGQDLKQPLSQTDQVLSHAQVLVKSQLQAASDFSHYSTASATSVNNHCIQYGCNVSNLKSPNKQEEQQEAHMTHNSLARKCHPSEIIHDPSELEGKCQQKKHHHRQQFKVGESLAGERYSPTRGSSTMERKHRDQSEASSPAKRTQTHVEEASTSSRHSRRKREDHLKNDEIEMVKKLGSTNRKADDGSIGVAQSSEQKQSVQGDKEKNGQHHDNHQGMNSKKSQGSFITKHADSNASPVQQLVKKFTNNEAEMTTSCESPRKMCGLKARGSEQQTEESQEGDVLCESLARKSFIIRQGSYVISDQVGKVDQDKSEAWSGSSKQARHSRKEERRLNYSPNKSSDFSLNKSSYVGQRSDHAEREVDEELRKGEQNGGRSTPGLCISTSDVSNFPFDDELTPADSDGMCQELKRDVRNVGYEQSSGARITYRKSAFKRNKGSSMMSFSSEDKDKTPQASACNGHVELYSSEERRKSISPQAPRNPKNNSFQGAAKNKKNRSFHNVSSNEESPQWSRKSKEASNTSRSLVQDECYEKNSYSCRDESDKFYQSEKLLQNKKNKYHLSAHMDGNSSMTKQVSRMSSKQSVQTSFKIQAEKCEDDEVVEERKVKSRHREKVDHINKSFEREDLASGKRRYQEENYHETDYRNERQLDTQHEIFDEHLCISPRTPDTSARYKLADTPINTSNKSSHYYSHGQYGSSDVSRGAGFTSRHLSNVGLGLGSSMTRSSALGLSPTKSMGTSYMKNSLNTQASSGCGMTSTTTAIYSSRRFLPTGVGTYLSSRLNSWYHGGSSKSYALNNNNDNDSHRHRTDCKDDADDEDDYANGSGFPHDNYLGGRHLNTNNNKDWELIDSLTGSHTHDKSKNIEEEDNNNNNNVKPININDISLEEIASVDSSDASTSNCVLFGDWDKVANEEAETCSDGQVLETVHHTVDQSSNLASDATENQCTVPSSQDNETVPNKPFITRRQPSLYRQLAQIHFSEKTRRYEWVVVPPQYTEVQLNTDPSCGLNNEHASKHFNFSSVTKEQTSESHGDSDLESMQAPKRERVDSKTSEDSCLNSASLSSFDPGTSYKNETCSRTGSITTTTTHSDSGLCSLSSYEGVHTCLYNRQKSRDNLIPAPAPNYSVSCCGLTPELHSQTPQMSISEGTMLQGYNNVSNMNNKSIKVLNGFIADSKTITTTTSTISSNSRTVTTVTSCGHSKSIVSTSPPATMMKSFMGVADIQEEMQYPESQVHCDGHCENRQTHGKCSNLERHSSSLDEVVKKLDFDDTTLDSSSGETITDNNHLEKKLKSDRAKLVVDAIDIQTPKSFETLLTKKECLTILERAGNLSFPPKIVCDKIEKRHGESPKNKEGKRYMLSTWAETDLRCTFNQENCEKDCNNADVNNQPSLSEYFQDISTLSAEPSSTMSPKNEEVTSYKSNAVLIKGCEKSECAHGSKEEFNHKDIEVETRTNSDCSHHIGRVFNPHTKRYESFLRLHNRSNKEIGDGDAGLAKRFAVERLPYCLDPDIEKAQHTHSVEEDMNHTLPFQGLYRQNGIWIYEDSVEKVAEHFDEKLSSFLEEKDLANTTQKVLQGSPPPMSPASKLQHLLLESQHLIWALERSSAVPEGLRSGVTHF